MATETSDSNKIQLLFKEFTGVVNAKQAEPFPLEEYAFKDYILNENILAQDIPDSLPNGWRSSQLDASSSIQDNHIKNLSSIGFPQLSFYKKKTLTPATFGSVKTWYVDDGQGGSDLKNAISFKFDPINNSYNYAVYLSFPGPVYSPLNMYSNPSFWLFDFKSGFLEFYGEEDDINGVNGTGIDLNANPPVISFIKYVGNTGGGGGTGNDASFNNVDISGNLSLQNNNLMQSYTSIPWPEPTDLTRAPAPYNTYYIIATVDKNNGFENPLGYFTLQIGPLYKQVLSFYAGIIESGSSTRPFIKIISNTLQDVTGGFQNLQIIEWPQPSTSTGTYYLVTTFKTRTGGQTIETFKISLTNNNGNGENIITGQNPDWMLRNEDPDWNVMGPQPPATKAPWTTNPTYSIQPLLPPAELTVPLTNHGGGPYGLTTQPEYFQNDIVMGLNGNIVANDGTGTIDICGNLFVDRDASFNQSVHIRDTLDVSNNANIQNNLDVGNNIRGRYKLKIDNDAVFGQNVNIGTTLTVDSILSNAPSSNFYTGLNSEANNFYFKVNTPATGQGFVLNLNKTNDDHAFKIIDGSGSSLNTLFKIGGSGLTQTQNIYPFLNNTYNIGYKDPSNPNADFRYNNLYVNNVDTNTLITDDISANKFYQKLSGSSLLDFSSINITPSGSLNYYDVAYLVNPADVSSNKLIQGSALIEIYLVEYANSIASVDKIEYIKCEISEFRASTASITVISAGNIPDSSDRILKSLKLNYGFNNQGQAPYFDPGALFQIGLEDSTNTTQKLFCRIYQNNPIDPHQTGIANIEEGKWDLALSNTPNNNPKFGTPAKSYESYYVVDLDFNPNGGTITTQPVSGGKLMYVNDKDSKFTSNVRFKEDVRFKKNVQIDGIISDLTTTNLNSTNIDVSNINIDTRINIPVQDSSSSLINTNLINTGDIGILEDISGSDISGASIVMKIRNANIRVSNIQILNFGNEQLPYSSPSTPPGSGSPYFVPKKLPYLFPFQLSIGLSDDNRFNCPFKGKIIGWTLLSSSSKQATLVNLKATAGSGTNGSGTMTASYQLILEKNSTDIILEEEENFNSTTSPSITTYTLGNKLNGTKGLWPEAKREFLEEGDLINLKIKYGFEWSNSSGVPIQNDNEIWFDNNAFGVGLLFEFFIPV
jgi:hypothetical protein